MINKIYVVIVAITTAMVLATVVSALTLMQEANAVCGTAGCSNPNGSRNSTTGSITPCVNGYRNITSGTTVLHQKC